VTLLECEEDIGNVKVVAISSQRDELSNQEALLILDKLRPYLENNDFLP
jgi:hypothetical protein